MGGSFGWRTFSDDALAHELKLLHTHTLIGLPGGCCCRVSIITAWRQLGDGIYDFGMAKGAEEVEEGEEEVEETVCKVSRIVYLH